MNRRYRITLFRFFEERKGVHPFLLASLNFYPFTMPPKAPKKVKLDTDPQADPNAQAAQPTAVVDQQTVEQAKIIADLKQALLQNRIDQLEAERLATQQAAAKPPAPPAPAPAAAGGTSNDLVLAVMQQQQVAQQQQQAFMAQMFAQQGNAQNLANAPTIPPMLDPQFQHGTAEIRSITRGVGHAASASFKPFTNQAKKQLEVAANSVEFGKHVASLENLQAGQQTANLVKQAEDLHKASYGKVVHALLSMLDTAAEECTRTPSSRRPDSSRSRNSLPRGGFCYVCVSFFPKELSSFFTRHQHLFYPLFFSSYIIIFQIILAFESPAQILDIIISDSVFVTNLWASSLPYIHFRFCGIVPRVPPPSLSDFFHTHFNYYLLPPHPPLCSLVSSLFGSHRAPLSTGKAVPPANGSSTKAHCQPPMAQSPTQRVREIKDPTRADNIFSFLQFFTIFTPALAAYTLVSLQQHIHATIAKYHSTEIIHRTSPSSHTTLSGSDNHFRSIKEVSTTSFVNTFNTVHANTIVAGLRVPTLTTTPSILQPQQPLIGPRRFLRQPIGAALAAAPIDERSPSRRLTRFNQKRAEAARIRKILYDQDGAMTSLPMPPLDPPQVNHTGNASTTLTVAPHIAVRSALPFWENVLHANTLALNIIKDGAPPDLAYPLPHNGIHMQPYELSVEDNTFINAELDRLAKQGTIEFIDKRPTVTCSLFTVSKLTGSGKLSKRMCINSVPLNAFCTPRTFQVEGIDTVVNMINPDDYLFTYDCSDAFFSVPASLLLQDLLGFETQDGRFGRFLALCFGWLNSPYYFALLFCTLRAHWRTLGYRVSTYGDDALLAIAGTITARALAGERLLTDLTSAGFRANTSKAQSDVREAVYIGYVINITEGLLLLKAARSKKIIQRAENILARAHLSCRDLSKLTSSVVSAAAIFGSTASLHTRNSNAWLGQVLNGTYARWDTQYPLPPRVQQEVEFWLAHIATNPSRPLWISTFKRHMIAASDASATGIGGSLYSIDVNIATTVAESFTAAQAIQSSTHREVRAAQSLQRTTHPRLLHLLDSTNSKLLITHLLDSKSAVSILTSGSNIPELHDIAVDMDSRNREQHIVANYVWHPRNDVLAQHADYLSRLATSDIYDYEIRFTTFHRIALQLWKKYHLAPSIDLFASRHNTKCPRFYSKYPMPGSMGTQVEHHHLPAIPGGYYFAHPPPPLISSFIKRLPLPSPVLLIVPQYPKSPWIPTLLDRHARFTYEQLNTLTTSQMATGPIGTMIKKANNTKFLVFFVHAQ